MMCPTTDGLFREGILLHSAFLQALHSPRWRPDYQRSRQTGFLMGSFGCEILGRPGAKSPLEGGGGMVLLPQTFFLGKLYISSICLPWLKSLIYGVDGLPENRSSFALEVAPLVDSWISLILHIWDQWTSESPWIPCEFWCKQQNNQGFEWFWAIPQTSKLTAPVACGEANVAWKRPFPSSPRPLRSAMKSPDSPMTLKISSCKSSLDGFVDSPWI